MRRIPAIGLLLSCLVLPLNAQDRVIQQPVVRQTEVATTVAIPDQGRALLGEVRSGASGTKRFGGPLRSGTNSGRAFSAISQTVSVSIHDFEAMDQAVLRSAKPQARRFETAANRRASHAWNTLAARQGMTAR